MRRGFPIGDSAYAEGELRSFHGMRTRMRLWSRSSLNKLEHYRSYRSHTRLWNNLDDMTGTLKVTLNKLFNYAAVIFENFFPLV